MIVLLLRDGWFVGSSRDFLDQAAGFSDLDIFRYGYRVRKEGMRLVSERGPNGNSRTHNSSITETMSANEMDVYVIL